MIVLAVTLVLSIGFCGLYAGLARRWHLVDHPNERSSHSIPTPHGGGVPLLLAFLAGFLLCAPWSFDYIWLVSVALVLMLLGIVDDLHSLPVSLRFCLYALVALVTSVTLLRPLLSEPSLVAVLQVLCFAFAIMWALNLYNFMDGIDGIAAAQCVLACLGAALLVSQNTARQDYVLFCALLAASQLGFLLWNWSPASLFMGDAGSIPTGFLLAGLAGYGAIQDILPFACWMVILAVFVADASATLCWRLFTGQKFTQAHRLHGYQRLSRHWGSHRAVVILLAAISVFWLFPLAWVVQQWPDASVYLVILAYFPLLLGMAKLAKLP